MKWGVETGMERGWRERGQGGGDKKGGREGRDGWNLVHGNTTPQIKCVSCVTGGLTSLRCRCRHPCRQPQHGNPLRRGPQQRGTLVHQARSSDMCQGGSEEW